MSERTVLDDPSPYAWGMTGAPLPEILAQLRALAAAEDDVTSSVWPPYDLVDVLGCAAVVDFQLRSAFARWIEALRGQRLQRLPGSFGHHA